MTKIQFSKISKTGFVRSVLVVLTGTAIAQAVAIFSLPVLTRIYLPEDFGTLAVYTSVVGIISVAASLRFELAIPIPEDDESAVNLAGLSFGILSLVCIILSIIIAGASDWMSGVIKSPNFNSHIWLLPPGIFLIGVFNICQYWNIRFRDFGVMAKSKISQSLGVGGAQVVFGICSFGYLGLVLGQLLGNLFGIFFSIKKIFQYQMILVRLIKFQKIKNLFFEYRQFPKLSTPEALINTAGIQLPIIIIASILTTAEAGFIMLAMKALQVPMGLIGGSISQVYFSQAIIEKKNGELKNFTRTIVINLIKNGVGPLIVVGLIAPDLFSIVFGDSWRRAGILVAWMTPWFAFQLLASPISTIMLVENKQAIMLRLTVFGIFIRVGSVFLASWLFMSIHSELYALSGAIYYCVCLMVFCSAAGFGVSDYRQVVKSSFMYLIIWFVFAVALSFVIQRIS